MKALLKKIVPEPLWIQLRLLKLRLTKMTYVSSVVHHDYGGHKFKVNIRDPLARGWYAGDWPRLPEIEELSRSRLKKGARVFDLGAHQAVVAMMLGKEVGEKGQVVALEAMGHNYRVAMDNVALNGLAQVKVLHRALGGERGKAQISESFNASLDTGKGDWGQEEVDMLSIDDLAQEFGPPDVVFMDVEGFEGAGLKGAARTLSSKCDWFVEVHGQEMLNKYGSSVEEVMSHFPFSRFKLRVAMPDGKFMDYAPGGPSPFPLHDRFFLLAFAV